MRSIGILIALLSCCGFIQYTHSHSSSQAKFYELIDLHEDNWDEMLNDEWMVEFFAPWCPACKNLQPIWERLAGAVGGLGVHVGKVDVTTSPSLSGRFLVTALPTIYHVKDGVFRQYKGSRDVESFHSFLAEKQWEKIEPVSNWKQPNSIQMSILSQLFKLSHILKDINTKLYEQYGIPTWGCYALFTVATICLSASLGLIMICIIDQIFPPKKTHRQSFSESKDKVEDVPNDEIEDDEEEIEESEDKKTGDEEEEEDDETSEGEKNSHSENDSEDEGTETEKKRDSKGEGEPADAVDEGKSSPRELRKRKPRKAD